MGKFSDNYVLGLEQELKRVKDASHEAGIKDLYIRESNELEIVRCRARIHDLEGWLGAIEARSKPLIGQEQEDVGFFAKTLAYIHTIAQGSRKSGV